MIIELHTAQTTYSLIWFGMNSKKRCSIVSKFLYWTSHYISKLDLLVRVRYANPLPEPPCPPKFLQIPTHPMRYATAEFLNSVATHVSLPMIVDADCGMPLDIARWPSLWDNTADDSGQQTPI
jgi:hypothetical protein